jgi:hypothetical protein
MSSPPARSAGRGTARFLRWCAANALGAVVVIMAPVPQAMQLRYLATLFDIASERSSTIVFPFPIDLMTATQR